MNIIEIKDMILAALAAAGSAIAGALGGWDAALSTLLILMAIDYVTGVLVAAVWHKSGKTDSGGVSSTAGAKGLLRKGVTLLMVLLGATLDRVLGIDYVRTAVCLFYIANEGISILENTAIMGVPYPKFVENMLDAMKKENDNPGHLTDEGEKADYEVKTPELPDDKEDADHEAG